MKNKYKIIIAIIIGITLVSVVSVYATTTILKSEDVSYDNTSSSISSNNVQDAIDELYSKVGSGSGSGISVTVDGVKKTSVPERGAYTVTITCNDSTTGEWDYLNWAAKMSNLSSDTECTIAFVTGMNMTDYVISLASDYDTNKVVKIEQASTTQTGSNATIEYRYSGTGTINNYVYFGCETGSCTDDNLYRIIGVFNVQTEADGTYEQRVKLIKATNWVGTSPSSTSYTSSGKGYQWYSGSNKWESSTVYKVLNGEYYTSLGDYQDFIATTVFYTGATSYSNYSTYTPKQFYAAERGSTKGYSGGSLRTASKIGLMYPSDYAFSLGGNSTTMWDTAVNTNRSTYKSSSWLYNNLGSSYYEWTIMPESSSSYLGAWHVYYAGRLYSDTVAYAFGVRPVFYLNSSVIYVSGAGSSTDPYIISMG